MNTSNIFGEEKKDQIDGSNGYGLKRTGGTTTGESGLKDTSIIIQPEPKLELVEQQDITQHLLKDETLADVLNNACLKGVTHISDGDGGSIIVPDYKLRLKAAEMELKLKGHFREKRVKTGLIDAIYKMG